MTLLLYIMSTAVSNFYKSRLAKILFGERTGLRYSVSYTKKIAHVYSNIERAVFSNHHHHRQHIVKRHAAGTHEAHTRTLYAQWLLLAVAVAAAALTNGGPWYRGRGGRCETCQSNQPRRPSSSGHLPICLQSNLEPRTVPTLVLVLIH